MPIRFYSQPIRDPDEIDSANQARFREECLDLFHQILSDLDTSGFKLSEMYQAYTHFNGKNVFSKKHLAWLVEAELLYFEPGSKKYSVIAGIDEDFDEDQ
jgi:hypothetical protein